MGLGTVVGVGDGVGVTGKDGVGGVGLGMSVPVPGSDTGGEETLPDSSGTSSEGLGLGDSSSCISPKMFVGFI